MCIICTFLMTQESEKTLHLYHLVQRPQLLSGFTPLLRRKLWIGALGSLPELTPPDGSPSPYCSSSRFLSWQVLCDPINSEPPLGLQSGPELMTFWKGICLR